MALTPERRRERLTGIGGSDAAVALGQSPWKTPYKLWREKTGLDKDEDSAVSVHAEWGGLLEDVVASKWARATGMKIQRINTMLRHPVYTYMVANIDRAVVNPAIAGRVVWTGKRLTTDRVLEVKTALTGWTDDKWGDEGTDQIPRHYLVQAMHYIIVAGVELCPVGLLLAGPQFRQYEVKRDPEVIDMIIEGEDEFWKMVESRTPPEATTIEDIRLRFPVHVEGLAVEATARVAAAFHTYAALKAQVNQADAAAKPHALTIQKHMGDAETLTIQGVPVLTWRKSKDGEDIDVDRLRAEYPGIYEELLLEKTGSRRMLPLKRKKGT